MPPSSLIAAVHARTARVAVGPSAVRRQGKGCANAARRFFASLDLNRFSRVNAKTFPAKLDAVTRELEKALPKKSRSWGLSRKLLNIFLRDSLYTTYMKEAYRLDGMEPFLGVPLDSITARRIKQAAGRGMLPAWPGVKNLKSALSQRFQAAAEVEAKRRGVARVHLDTFWWGQREGAA